MEEELQHEESAQCFGLSTSDSRNDRQDGPRAGHALTFIVDLSKGANQPTDKLYRMSDILITDWSGSALSFAFSTEKPTLFMDTPAKVLNGDYDEYGMVSLEVSIRETIGTLLDPDSLDSAPIAIENLYMNRIQYAEQIRKVRGSYVYNFGCSASHGAHYINSVATSMDNGESQ